MNFPAPVSKYASVAANAVWTIGWGAAAFRAFQHLETVHDRAAILGMAVTTVCLLFGCFMTVRIIRRLPGLRQEEKQYPRESWLTRVTGWVATFAWCVGGIGWNAGVFAILTRAAREGDAKTILIMVPFSLIGWFFLILLFVGIGLVADTIVAKVGGDETVKR